MATQRRPAYECAITHLPHVHTRQFNVGADDALPTARTEQRLLAAGPGSR